MKTVRRWGPPVAAALVLAAIVGAGRQDPPADPWPAELVRWRARVENPVFAGAGVASDAWDAKIRERGFILKRDDGYHLWYTGYNDARDDKTRMLGHATSPDGLKWERDPANPILPGNWVEDVFVVDRGDLIRMFAEGAGDVAHELTSTDGRSWTELGPLDIRKTDGTPIAPGPRGTPTVWVEGETWHLFYERGDLGVWLARSTDGKVWTNVRDDPVIAAGPDAYDRAAVAMNQVIRRDGWYYAVYHANARRPWGDWTTCLARSRDLESWEKYPGNPIVAANCSSGLFVEAPDGSLRLYTMHPEVRVFEPEATAPGAR